MFIFHVYGLGVLPVSVVSTIWFVSCLQRPCIGSPGLELQTVVSQISHGSEVTDIVNHLMGVGS